MPSEETRLQMMMRAAERNIILDAMDFVDHNVEEAAEYLGIGTSAMYKRLKKHDINPPRRKRRRKKNGAGAPSEDVQRLRSLDETDGADVEFGEEE